MSEQIKLVKPALEVKEVQQETKIKNDNKSTQESLKPTGRPKRIDKLSHISDSFLASCKGSNYLDNLR